MEPVEKTRSGPFCANLAISPSPVLYAVLRGNGGRAGQRPRGKPGDRTLNDSKDETQPRERVFHVVVYRRRVSIVPSLRAGTRNAREGEPGLVASIPAGKGEGRVQRRSKAVHRHEEECSPRLRTALARRSAPPSLPGVEMLHEGAAPRRSNAAVEPDQTRVLAQYPTRAPRELTRTFSTPRPRSAASAIRSAKTKIQHLFGGCPKGFRVVRPFFNSLKQRCCTGV